MKKLISFLVFIVIVIYILVEFVGDSVIKGSLESNITTTLDRKTTIGNLNINYLSGSAEIEDLKIQNKRFSWSFNFIKEGICKIKYFFDI